MRRFNTYAAEEAARPAGAARTQPPPAVQERK
jgi:hypothetical protein